MKCLKCDRVFDPRGCFLPLSDQDLYDFIDPNPDEDPALSECEGQQSQMSCIKVGNYPSCTHSHVGNVFCQHLGKGWWQMSNMKNRPLTLNPLLRKIKSICGDWSLVWFDCVCYRNWRKFFTCPNKAKIRTAGKRSRGEFIITLVL